jgi:galactose-6-phosphate isomerase
MPLLDVSDVLADPMLSDTFKVRRYVRSVSEVNGRAEDRFYDTVATGVVVPASQGALSRTPDAERQGDSITVYTTFGLTLGTAQGDPTDPSGTTGADTIIWHDLEWIVTSVNDWTGFGAGFVQASCIQRPIDGAPDDPMTAE